MEPPSDLGSPTVMETWSAISSAVPPDLLKIVACLVLNYPLAYVAGLLPRRLRAPFSLTFGLVYLCLIFNFWKDTLMLVAQCALAYIMCLYGTPWLNHFLQVAILMSTHFREQLGGGDYVNEIGISGSQMVLVIKLTSFVWDYSDRLAKAEDMTPHQRENKIEKLPSVLDYLAWCFFFPSVLTGPTCQYKDFGAWLDQGMQTNGKPHVRKVLGTYKAAAFKTVAAVLYTVLYFSTSSITDRDYLLEGQWAALPFVHRAMYLGLLSACYQVKYYVAWSFAEAACILSGLSFNGERDGRMRFDKLENVRPVKILTGQNCHGYVNNWNINTANWLRYYVYERVTPPGQKPGFKSTLATFFFSAVWHGTRPGYYLTFILIAIYQRMGRLLRHKVRPVFLGTNFKFGYDLVCWVVTQAAFGFSVQPFVLLDLEPSLYVWKHVYYWPLVGCGVAVAVLVWPFGGFYRKASRVLHKDLKNVN